jgi:hypothetical protein
MIKQKTSAADVFRRFGLQSTGLLGAIAVPPRGDGRGPGRKLKESFEQLGGLYLSFADFLLWRADLLGVDYLLALREIEQTVPPVPHSTVAAMLRADLGRRGDELAHRLETEPVWSTRSRTAYLSRYKGKTVVVQVAREPVSESEFAEFETGIAFLGNRDVSRVTAPGILAEFREWLRQAESCVTERSYLEVLGRNRNQTLVDYPVLIPEITTDRVLCWPWVEGDSLRSLIGRGSVEAVTQVAVAVLEQYCSLSIVDADLPLDAMVMAPGAKRLTIRRFNRPLTVPLALVNTGMKYVAAVLEGNASRVAQTLVNLSLGKSTASLETSLLELMSAIEPELKVGLSFPGSTAAFESNWRALARLPIARPLYLNCLHRNLIATGYWTAEAFAAGGEAVDTITEAHWPVVARIVKLNAAQLLDPTVATEWSVGIGLLSFGAMREANRLAEEVRDNNLTMEVETGPAQQSAPRLTRRNFPTTVLIACLLAIILATLRWGSPMAQPTQGLMVAVAYVALAVMFWAVAKLG